MNRGIASGTGTGTGTGTTCFESQSFQILPSQLATHQFVRRGAGEGVDDHEVIDLEEWVELPSNGLAQFPQQPVFFDLMRDHHEHDQLFCPSVRDDVAFGPRNMGLPNEEVEARVTGALSAVGVLKLADRPSHHLSEGEKRMVSIAGVLAMRPRLMIYDEPGANLDIRSRRRLIRLLQASKETLLVASHDLELVLEVCSRVVLIDEGRIVADGDPREIMSDDRLMEAHGQEKPHSLIPHQIPH